MSGRLEAIHVAEKSGSPMRSLERCSVTIEAGLLGDRHGTREDTGQVTVVSREELSEVAAAKDFVIEQGATRGNLSVSGVALRHPAGLRLRLGPVLLDFVQSSQPCSLMKTLFGPGAMAVLKGKTGMEMRVLEAGELRVGDSVSPKPDA